MIDWNNVAQWAAIVLIAYNVLANRNQCDKLWRAMQHIEDLRKSKETAQ